MLWFATSEKAFETISKFYDARTGVFCKDRIAPVLAMMAVACRSMLKCEWDTAKQECVKLHDDIRQLMVGTSKNKEVKQKFLKHLLDQLMVRIPITIDSLGEDDANAQAIGALRELAESSLKYIVLENQKMWYPVMDTFQDFLHATTPKKLDLEEDDAADVVNNLAQCIMRFNDELDDMKQLVTETKAVAAAAEQIAEAADTKAAHAKKNAVDTKSIVQRIAKVETSLTNKLKHIHGAKDDSKVHLMESEVARAVALASAVQADVQQLNETQQQQSTRIDARLDSGEDRLAELEARIAELETKQRNVPEAMEALAIVDDMQCQMDHLSAKGAMLNARLRLVDSLEKRAKKVEDKLNGVVNQLHLQLNSMWNSCVMQYNNLNAMHAMSP